MPVTVWNQRTINRFIAKIGKANTKATHKRYVSKPYDVMPTCDSSLNKKGKNFAMQQKGSRKKSLSEISYVKQSWYITLKYNFENK